MSHFSYTLMPDPPAGPVQVSGGGLCATRLALLRGVWEGRCRTPAEEPQDRPGPTPTAGGRDASSRGLCPGPGTGHPESPASTPVRGILVITLLEGVKALSPTGTLPRDCRLPDLLGDDREIVRLPSRPVALADPLADLANRDRSAFSAIRRAATTTRVLCDLSEDGRRLSQSRWRAARCVPYRALRPLGSRARRQPAEVLGERGRMAATRRTGPWRADRARAPVRGGWRRSSPLVVGALHGGADSHGAGLRPLGACGEMMPDSDRGSSGPSRTGGTPEDTVRQDCYGLSSSLSSHESWEMVVLLSGALVRTNPPGTGLTGRGVACCRLSPMPSVLPGAMSALAGIAPAGVSPVACDRCVRLSAYRGSRTSSGLPGSAARTGTGSRDRLRRRRDRGVFGVLGG